MSGTLAYNMRPQSLLDILGQKHIIGKNGLFTKFVEKNHPMSVILYGPPGCGNTTLAMALAHDLNMPCRTFNASTGNNDPIGYSSTASYEIKNSDKKVVKTLKPLFIKNTTALI